MDFELKLNFAYRCLVGRQADLVVKKVVRGFVKHCQILKSDNMLLGPDSGLDNVWDEVCVDTQGEHSFYHNEYVSFIEQYVETVMFPKLTNLEKTVLWTQTRAFEEWLEEIEERQEELPSYIDFSEWQDDGSVVEYICSAIIEEASNYSNSRIEKYLTR